MLKEVSFMVYEDCVYVEQLLDDHSIGSFVEPDGSGESCVVTVLEDDASDTAEILSRYDIEWE